MESSKKVDEVLKDLIEFTTFCFDYSAANSISKNFRIMLFPSFKSWTKIMLYPAIHETALTKVFSKLKTIGSGVLAGWLWGGRFMPSPHFYNFVKSFTNSIGCAIVAKTQGVKAFLYGNDLLLASFEKALPPVSKGKPVAVLDSEDYMAIGIGIALFELREIEMLLKSGKMLTPIVKNVFDLGMHIRDEEFFY
ncbi:hypothetical protein QPL79_09050 [Ignisphaera sp. 4213-co]|uniref:UPF0113 domain-containing protein n=1 Tax=Ignisphaera cupida TaxID=3050454 RepID=A0ABD4Z8G4_9CREN|nr:hypothetical protein [Ignisphaera sp. 4213-co]MDK6029510.1 hypothetical protein [Ignisphaera sp. 4213-co]